MLRAELIERGFDAVGYITVRDAIESLPMRRPEVIFVDLRGQPMPLAERLLKLGVPVILLGGATELSDLPKGNWAEVLQRPISIGEIAEKIGTWSAGF